MLRAKWMHSRLRGTPLVREMWKRQFSAGYAYGECLQLGLLPIQCFRMTWSLLCLPYRRGWATAELVFK